MSTQDLAIKRARFKFRARARQLGYTVEDRPRDNQLDRAPRVALHQFVREAWHVHHPHTPFIDNWHIGAICEHLTACTYGQIQKLIINIPPGFGKSLIVSVYWPMWEWTFQPWLKHLFSSYNKEFATRDSLRCRDLILSEYYQQRYGDVFALKGDMNLKTYFQNTESGHRMCFGAKGGTGARGDRINTDDPHNIEKIESEADRESVNHWWGQTMSQRGNDPQTAVWTVTMQRLAEDDLTGFLLAEQLGYDHLCLPMHYDPQHPLANIPSRPTTIGFSDPRAIENGGAGEGALIFPKRYPEAVVNGLAKALQGYGAAGQHEQNPMPRGGLFFPMLRIKKYTQTPKDITAWCRYWDKAGTEGGGAWTVGALVGKRVIGMVGDPNSNQQIEIAEFYIEDVVRRQQAFTKREATIREVAQQDAARFGPGVVQQVVEQEPGSGGRDVATISIHNLAGHSIKADKAGSDGDKETRARPLANAMENGLIFIKDSEDSSHWHKIVIDKLSAFPRGGKDETDAIGGAYRKLALRRKQKKRPKSSSTSAY
jgi:predicted phage terminase large subunit-like protein